jgi:hypothetical protein
MAHAPPLMLAVMTGLWPNQQFQWGLVLPLHVRMQAIQTAPRRVALALRAPHQAVGHAWVP